MARAGPSLDDQIRSIQEQHVLAALRECRWNVTRAAMRLGVSRDRLRYWIEKRALAGRTGSGRRHAQPAPARPADVGGRVLASRSADPLRWERRHLAYLRVELLRSPEPGTRVDSSRLLTDVSDKIGSLGGTVQEVRSNAVVAVFGLQSADSLSIAAALAALAIAKSAERWPPTDRAPAVRLALHVGEALVARVRGQTLIDPEDRQRAWHALEQLAGATAAGTVVLSEAAVPFLDRQFEIGRGSPVSGEAAVLHLLTRRERTGFGLGGRPLAPFVGRERELESMHGRLAQAARGEGQIVGVVGEPGVGKSRFLYEVTRADPARVWRVLSTGGVAPEASIPWLPVTRLVRRYLQLDETDSAERVADVVNLALRGRAPLERHRAALLAVLDGHVEDDAGWQGLDPGARRLRMIEAVKDLVLFESAAQPVLLVVEDLHWTDSETQAVLDRLAESLASSRVALLVSYRPEYQHNWARRTYYSQLRIDPLGDEQAADLLRALLGDSTSVRPLKSMLVERTGGNPFFLEESVRTLVETRMLAGDRGGYSLVTAAQATQLPATIEAMLTARIDRLPEDDKELLRSAAVVGKNVPLAVLRAVVDVPDDHLDRRLAALQTAEFLHQVPLAPHPEFTFKHALTHEAAYGGLAPERRQELHARSVEAIEDLIGDRLAENAERLAHHAYLGRVWRKAARYLRAAGRRALARSANRAAVSRFEEALVALGHLGEERETLEQMLGVHLDLCGARQLVGDYERPADHLRAAKTIAETLGDRRKLARIYGAWVQYADLTSDHRQALSLGREALVIADGLDDPAARAAGTYCLGVTNIYLGNYREAAPLLKRTVALLESGAVSKRLGVATRAYLGLALAELGAFAEGIPAGREAVEIAATLGHPASQIFAASHLGYDYLRQGDFEAAVGSLEGALTLCRETDCLSHFPWVACMLGAAYARAGRPAAGVELAAQGVEAAKAMK
ncbi:MAG: AAA family ATPase, partial [Candidatus Rokubacteria bacterium]|nr:AAA family ATPase [Candidatus Rokubacteria bacterium]